MKYHSKYYLLFVLLCWINIPLNAQLLSKERLATERIYTSLNDALINPEKVYRLDLSKQKLKVVSMEVFKLYNLQELILAKNKLQEIPIEIGTLTNLEILNVEKNGLAVLPPAIGSLTNLKELIVNRNEIYKLPPEIGNLLNLEKLDMWSNEIDEFPEEISKLKDTLKFLDLRVILINLEKQKKIVELLPNTYIYFNKSCNCR